MKAGVHSWVERFSLNRAVMVKVVDIELPDRDMHLRLSRHGMQEIQAVLTYTKLNLVAVKDPHSFDFEEYRDLGTIEVDDSLVARMVAFAEQRAAFLSEVKSLF
jgi:hypothetical protein